ncbi:MAG: hypothetical protein K0Q66_223 [Chitinophagaceae bacterium]|jgi:hypothetical protein|nr:hypothetical protein [Chitinophagaceae bacterium]
MRKTITAYFIIGLLLQLFILANIAYWFNLVASTDVRSAIERYAAKFPVFLQDATVIMLIVAALTIISMICYGAARNLSLNRTFRNLVMGLILVDGIIILWIILSLM